MVGFCEVGSRVPGSRLAQVPHPSIIMPSNSNGNDSATDDAIAIVAPRLAIR